jgi:hypothetical protein
MALVYKHIRKDSNEIFYIGIGKTSKRAHSKSYRNNHWWDVVNKHGYDVEIIKEGLSWEDAQQTEIELIAKYGRHDLSKGPLVNQTDGGDGNNNQIFTEETRLKMSKSHRGKRHSDETRKKMSDASIGKKKSPEHTEKNRLAKIGKTLSEETKEKIGQANLGRVDTDQTKALRSKINSLYFYEKWTKDGDLVETYESMYLALQSINKPSTYRGIYHSIDRIGSCGGYVWKRIQK